MVKRIELEGMNSLGEAKLESLDVKTDPNSVYPIMEARVTVFNPSIVEVFMGMLTLENILRESMQSVSMLTHRNT